MANTMNALCRDFLLARVAVVLALLVATAASLVMARAATAAPVSIKPGEYVTAGGWGTLHIKRGSANASSVGELSFSIDALAGNGHSCSLEGTIRDGVARLAAMDDAKPCVVSFVAKTSGTAITGIEVQERSDAAICRYFCGARADFNGVYLTPPSGCRPSMIRQSQDAFLKAYQRKDYARAESWLAPILANCTSVLWSLSTYNIRNDLAVTYYHLGQRAACLRVLEPMQSILGKSEAQLKEDYPPTYADNMIAVRKAGLTNQRLCESLPGR
jgi:hypothetical protein